MAAPTPVGTIITLVYALLNCFNNPQQKVGIFFNFLFSRYTSFQLTLLGRRKVEHEILMGVAEFCGSRPNLRPTPAGNERPRLRLVIQFQSTPEILLWSMVDDKIIKRHFCPFNKAQ